MTISICIPSYNQQEYLSEAIESAINQTRKADEIIVVDDGSTDNSLAIAKKYPVKVIAVTNKGLPGARNAGIMNATSDYILFLDADDMLLENCLEELEKHILDTNADVVSPSFKCFGKDQNEVILMPNPKLEDFKTGNRIGYCSAVKRSTLLEVGGYNPRMNLGFEDYDLWFDLLKREKTFVTIPKVLWLYRTKEESMITNSMRHKDEIMAQIYKNHPSIWPPIL